MFDDGRKYRLREAIVYFSRRGRRGRSCKSRSVATPVAITDKSIPRSENQTKVYITSVYGVG